MKCPTAFVALTLMLGAQSLLGADNVALRNGDWLSGTIATMQDGQLSMQTDYAGTIEIEWDQVSRLSLAAPLPVVLRDGSEREAREMPTSEIRLADVVAIAPVPAPPIRWRGRLDFGYTKTGGNRSTELGTLTAFAERDYDDVNTLSLLFDAAQGESDGEATANRARIQGKYDRAVDTNTYR